MNLVEERTLAILNRSTEIIRELPDSVRWLDEIATLKLQVYTPCRLAVGGRVKAGESTFINTLLGEDLALVGETEATATVNRFVYGKPANPALSKSFIKMAERNSSVRHLWILCRDMTPLWLPNGGISSILSVSWRTRF